MRPFDPTDTQGNVVRGFDLPHAYYLHVTLPDSPGASRRLVRALCADVTTAEWQAEHQGDCRRALVNLALTSEGLKRCGLTQEQVTAWFAPEFVQGMSARAVLDLGDAGNNAPDYWEWPGFKSHLLVAVYACDPDTLEGAARSLRAHTRAFGVPTQEQRASVLTGSQRRGNREHFGFVDGISQPPLDTGGAVEREAIGGIPIAGGGWAAVPAGEFVLGLADIDEDEPHLGCPELMRNGSFLVYRKIRQDVRAFRDWVDEAARTPAGQELDSRPGRAAEIIAAKLVGRYPDGTPLIPTVGPPGAAASNDFRYGDDPVGMQCPLGSHIRRANPRDGLPFGGALVNRHRIIRRGMPYGRPYDEQPEDPERGLIFVAYCASIARQFEFIQRRWLNDGDLLGLGRNTDPLSGTGKRGERFSVPHHNGAALFGRLQADFTQFVQVRWGDYFFQPGLKGLAWLCDPHHRAQPPRFWAQR